MPWPTLLAACVPWLPAVCGAVALQASALQPGSAVQQDGADAAAQAPWLEFLLGTGVDGLGFAVVALFALLGAWRGLWWQVVRLLGLAGAVLLARALAPDLAERLEPHLAQTDSLVLGASAWLLVFLGGLGLAVAVGRLGKRVLDALQLSLVDRAGGALAGGLTGLLLHGVAVALLLQLATPGWTALHLHGTRSERLVELLGSEASVLFDRRTAHALEHRRHLHGGEAEATVEPDAPPRESLVR